jgi:hypothetical protein
LAIQESSNKQQQASIHERAAAVERMYHEQQEYRLTHAVNASGAAPASVDRVYAIVEDVIRDRRLGEVSYGTTHRDCIDSIVVFRRKEMGIRKEESKCNALSSV